MTFESLLDDVFTTSSFSQNRQEVIGRGRACPTPETFCPSVRETIRKFSGDDLATHHSVDTNVDHMIYVGIGFRVHVIDIFGGFHKMLEMNPNPFLHFEDWFESAKITELSNPEAASLATCDQSGGPHVRIVLVKGADQNGFTFFTNLGSAKARDLMTNSRAALCFHWKTQKRQIRIEGAAALVSGEEADRYFETRPRLSQIGAWASNQSQPLTDESELRNSIAKFTARFHVGKVPRPEFWSGYRLIPEKMEFWEERPFRLHRRRLYTKSSDRWVDGLIYP